MSRRNIRWFEGLFGIKRGEKTWTIEGNNEVREVSKKAEVDQQVHRIQLSTRQVSRVC